MVGGLPITVCSYKKLAIFTTNSNAENHTLINHKCVCGALNRQFLVGAVSGCGSFRSNHYCVKFALSLCGCLQALLLFLNGLKLWQKSKCACKCVGDCSHIKSYNLITAINNSFSLSSISSMFGYMSYVLGIPVP